MNTMVLLMALSVAGVAALFIALACFLFQIVHELEAIGGQATRFRRPVNFLSKIRLGLRAIEVETGHLAPQVTRLNRGLEGVRAGLRAIDGHLGGVIEAVSRQGR